MPSRIPSSRTQSPSVAALVLMLGAAGCSRPPEVPKVLDSVRSWTATARFAAEDFQSGATTALYTAEIRDLAGQALTDARQRLAARPTPPDTAREIAAATDSLSAAVRLLAAELTTR